MQEISSELDYASTLDKRERRKESRPRKEVRPWIGVTFGMRFLNKALRLDTPSLGLRLRYIH